ncbi:FUSC family protein [Alloacidobacterium dinghuense]|uniref:FUSC family protein n=1 Tax=Alloacidobacterium dinghuense TaxID=2763107 RepID=A0A7G8BD72_9BACT|nr:FUSC family protein [Alloacidobacterium dinghuense]QNI30492.1 FUSC family protein [Alloacidobacterium dinghuense]
MTTYSGSNSSVRNLIEVLRAELTWYPGRPALVARMVLACTSVVLLAEIFRIPGAVLGASFPILISRDNLKATRKTAFQIALACSIGTAEVIVGGMLTAGSPFLHVMWVIVSLFAAFYVISSLNFTSASLTLSAILAIAIRLWDYPIRAETRVESSLYTLLSILIGCVVSVLIETVFSKKSPPDIVLDGISRRLSLVETLLNRPSFADFPSSALRIQLGRAASRGVDDLRQHLANPSYDTGFRDLLATVIALTRQLIELGSNLAESAPDLSVEDQERCRAIARNLASVRSSLGRMECPEWIDLPFTSHSSNPILIEIERTTGLITQSFCSESFRIHWSSPAAAPTTSISEFVTDALQNPEHIKFAVRGTLSAFLCYLFYMSTGWMGLVSSTLTCTLTARRLTGGGRQRQTLRFAGFVLGAGVISLGTEVFILPQLNTIAEFALLSASVVWVGSWIATSGPRIAFAGFQIILSYNLVNLNRFTINTSLVPSRDAVLGIVLGIVAMWLVFDHLWAETSGSSVRSLLLGTLRNLADFKAVAAETPQEANQRLAATSSRINRDFDKLRDLADLYAFESFPKMRRESLVNRSIRTLSPELRAFLLVKTGLLQHMKLAAAEPDAIVREVEEQASSVLHGIANAIESEAPEQLSRRNVDAQELRARVFIEEEKSRDWKDRWKQIEMRLCASLLEIASHLAWRARLNLALEVGDEEAVGDWPIGKIVET